MPEAIPSVLAPYLQDSFSESSLIILTSVLETPSAWLIPRCISAALYGVHADRRTGLETMSNDGATTEFSAVTFLSILRPYDLWVELGKKIGLDFALLSSQRRFAYIDGLTGSSTKLPSASGVLQPRSHSLPDLSSALATANLSSPQNVASRRKSTLIIDGLDFILASQPDVENQHLNAFIMDLRSKFSNVVITVAADAPLLHNTEASATPLEIQHSILVRTVAHQSNWIFQLRPLETGHAKDVTGVIQIAKGGANVVEDHSLPEGEWLYQVKGDGHVKLWGRGE